MQPLIHMHSGLASETGPADDLPFIIQAQAVALAPLSVPRSVIDRWCTGKHGITICISNISDNLASGADHHWQCRLRQDAQLSA